MSEHRDQSSPAYVDRVNRAIDFVLCHLDEPLRLEAVARAACFSPFHFHRVFRLLVGESLGDFIKRLRLERALALMSQRSGTTRRPRSLTDIAFACGFASSSDFTRCFRTRLGVSPSRFDLRAHREEHRRGWQQEAADPARPHLLDALPHGANPDGFQARQRYLPARQVAYLRVPRPFRPGVVQQAAERLVCWAEARGLADGQWLGYMWDDPDITAHEQCRYDVGVEVAVPFAPEGEVSRAKLVDTCSQPCRWPRSGSAAASTWNCGPSIGFTAPGYPPARSRRPNNLVSSRGPAGLSRKGASISSCACYCPYPPDNRSGSLRPFNPAVT